MFVTAQLPLADFRPLIKGGRGRLLLPDWSSDNLSSGFVRGFGKIAARNGSSLGLVGERAFADANKALRFYKLEFHQAGWTKPLPIALWFRRLYYDGQIAGRFEIGFMMPQDEVLARFENDPVDPPLIAQSILSAVVQINSVDGSHQRMMFADCPQALDLAYIASTTRNDALGEFPINETYGAAVFVGRPTLHIRVPAELKVQTSRDRRNLNAQDEHELFVTSARGSEIRNGVLVQGSARGIREETAGERVTRVLFAHLNALFAHAQFAKAGKAIKGLNTRAILRRTVSAMIDRFGHFTQVDNSAPDKEFTAGIKRFAKAYAGRIDELVAKLQQLSVELNNPTTLEWLRGYVRGVHDLAITAAVKSAAETAMKPK